MDVKSLLKIVSTLMFLPMIVPMYLRLELRGVCGKMEFHDGLGCGLFWLGFSR
jgi:hypothetical protein